MTEKDKKLKQAAIKWVRRKQNKQYLIEKFANLDECQPTNNPLVLFMAGSPGAGKTELSKELVRILNEEDESHYCRIDPDEIRDELPGYDGSNAYLFQQAISIAMDDLISHISKSNQNAIIDGTLAKYDTAKSNIKKIIERNGITGIIYVYQDPKVAWNFTQMREKLEGRRINKKDLVNTLFKARENVDILKEEFKDRLMVFLAEKDYRNKIKKFEINIDKIEHHSKLPYTKGELERSL